MTNNEAIQILKQMIPTPHRGDGKSTTHLLQTSALLMAIQSLETCKDCISREEAINEADLLDLETFYDNEKVIEMLKELPSIQLQ